MRKSTSEFKLAEAAEPQDNKRVSVEFFAPMSKVYVMTADGIAERKVIIAKTESRALISTDCNHTSSRVIYTLDDGSSRDDTHVFATKEELIASL